MLLCKIRIFALKQVNQLLNIRLFTHKINHIAYCFTFVKLINVYFNQLTEEESLKRYVMFNLLRDEFTRVLPENYREENQYYIAYSIAKRFFIEESVDAIQYPSCRGLGHQNFAFFEDHVRDNLEFVGLRACGLSEQKGTSANIIFFADGFGNEELNKFEYYSPYSDKSKLIFTQYLNIMMSK